MYISESLKEAFEDNGQLDNPELYIKLRGIYLNNRRVLMALVIKKADKEEWDNKQIFDYMMSSDLPLNLTEDERYDLLELLIIATEFSS